MLAVFYHVQPFGFRKRLAGCETGTQESTEEKRDVEVGVCQMVASDQSPVSSSWGIVEYFVTDSQWAWPGYK